MTYTEKLIFYLLVAVRVFLLLSVVWIVVVSIRKSGRINRKNTGGKQDNGA